MTDIQFYHLTSTPLERALPKILEKSLAGGFRVVVRMESVEKAEWLNGLLWAYDPGSFLPHGTDKDGRAEEQPIYITAREENPNGATLLVATDGRESTLTDGVQRLLDLFDGGSEEAVAAARARWKTYQAAGHSVTYIRQTESGGWEKQSA